MACFVIEITGGYPHNSLKGAVEALNRLKIKLVRGIGNAVSVGKQLAGEQNSFFIKIFLYVLTGLPGKKRRNI